MLHAPQFDEAAFAICTFAITAGMSRVISAMRRQKNVLMLKSFLGPLTQGRALGYRFSRIVLPPEIQTQCDLVATMRSMSTRSLPTSLGGKPGSIKDAIRPLFSMHHFKIKDDNVGRNFTRPQVAANSAYKVKKEDRMKKN